MINNISSTSQNLYKSSGILPNQELPLNKDLLQGLSSIFNKIENDSSFADEMAYAYSHSRDFELIDLDDVPLDGTSGSGKFKTMTDYLAHVNNFEIQANKVMSERISLYEKMKSESANGLEIFKEIMKLNQSLPVDFQKAAGLEILQRYNFKV